MIDFGDSRWATAHVAKIVDMDIRSDGELITCESLDGDRYELNLSGTKLHGFVSEYRSGATGAGKELPLWAEFGMVKPFIPYIELLFTSCEFDRLPRNARHRRFESEEGYRHLKRAHLVPVSVYDGEDLYYGQMFSV